MISAYKTNLAAIVTMATAFWSGAAWAGDDTVAVSIDAGMMRLRATETVYVGSFKLSELDWEATNVPVLRGAIAVNITPEWQIRAEAKGSLKGNSNMTDYDWIPPYYIDNSKSGWSHQSTHDDTSLDHYWSGNIDILHTLLDDPTQSLAAGIGAGYTDVQWTAHGGSFVYSVNATRDTAGTFAPGLKGITYRQQIPTAYALIEGTQKMGRFSIDLGAKAGVMFQGKATDDHWLRDLRVTEKFEMAPTFGASLGINYALTQSAKAYLKGTYDFTNLGRAPSTYTDTATGSAVTYGDTGAARFETIYVGGGLKASF